MPSHIGIGIDGGGLPCRRQPHRCQRDHVEALFNGGGGCRGWCVGIQGARHWPVAATGFPDTSIKGFQRGQAPVGGLGGIHGEQQLVTLIHQTAPDVHQGAHRDALPSVRSAGSGPVHQCRIGGAGKGRADQRPGDERNHHDGHPGGQHATGVGGVVGHPAFGGGQLGLLVNQQKHRGGTGEGNGGGHGVGVVSHQDGEDEHRDGRHYGLAGGPQPKCGPVGQKHGQKQRRTHHQEQSRLDAHRGHLDA